LGKGLVNKILKDVMNAQELKLLASKACTFETHKGGSSHVTVRRGGRKSHNLFHTSVEVHKDVEFGISLGFACDSRVSSVAESHPKQTRVEEGRPMRSRKLHSSVWL
jgi:hypothetical protein